uniref:Secreted protein n=1 Tax=Rhizophora mucronata TaxID=61149 RepID=A0A2P2KRE3_RHIMU
MKSTRSRFMWLFFDSHAAICFSFCHDGSPHLQFTVIKSLFLPNLKCSYFPYYFNPLHSAEVELTVICLVILANMMMLRRKK